jgi:hypothetical protein
VAARPETAKEKQSDTSDLQDKELSKEQSKIDCMNEKSKELDFCKDENQRKQISDSTR